MSRFRLFRHLLASTGGGGASVTYDARIGSGVDINGRTALPLYTPGSDGSDLATATPTLDSVNVTYSSGTRTLTATFTGPIARWTGILTIGQSYHIVLNVAQTSSCQLTLKDESANVMFTSSYSSGSYLVDAVFTATGHDLIFSPIDDGFAGTIQMVKVAPNTGGIGGRRFYVRPSTGSNSNNGTQAQSASTPLADVATALKFVQDGRGDQILIAQGETLTRGLANLASYGGHSLTYPLVIQSYDPADATNEAKLGTATGSNRPVINTNGADMTSGLIGTGVTAHHNRALRGLKFDGGGSAESAVGILSDGTGGTTPDGLLFENNEFSTAQLSISGIGVHLVQNVTVRNCSFHGQWDTIKPGDAQGFYIEASTGCIVEDCYFAHCGWKEGANYTDSGVSGGATIYGHPFYLQDDTRLSTVRRCVFIQNANDGGRPKGDCTYYQNMVINSDIAVNGGGGNFYTSAAPSGVDLQISYNAFLGGAQGGSGGWGIHVVNGKTGSSAHHNVLAQAAFSSYGLMADAEVDSTPAANPCYINYHDNVMDNWLKGGGMVAMGISGTSDMSLIHDVENNNYADGTVTGTNQDISALTRPTRYTVSSLITALGYADLATAQAAWVSDPASHGWRSGVKLALVGYGVDISAMPFLV